MVLSRDLLTNPYLLLSAKSADKDVMDIVLALKL